MIVWTEGFTAGGRVDLILQFNDNTSNSGIKTINTINTRRHIIKIDKGNVENLRVYLEFAQGSASVPVRIKKIEVIGSLMEQ